MAQRKTALGYILIGLAGYLVGSIVGRTIAGAIKAGGIKTILNLWGLNTKVFVYIWITFPFNLIALIGVLLAMYIYRRL